MKIEKLLVADLKPAEKNTRLHPAKQIEELVRSYKKFGQTRPVIIDEDNVIWCGNGLYLALVQAGETEVYCLRKTGMSEDDKKKLMLADNQIFTLGLTNASVMDEFLSTIQDFDVPGYDAEMLEQLYGDLEKATEEIMSYGVAAEETVQKISEAQAGREEAKETQVYTKTEQPQSAAHGASEDELPPTIKTADGMVNIPKDKNERPFIVCPKCGEKIWV